MPSESLFKMMQTLLHKQEHLGDCLDNLIARIEGLESVISAHSSEIKALKTLVYENAKSAKASTPNQPESVGNPTPYGELNAYEKGIAFKESPGSSVYGKIEAIKSYKNRTGCQLKEAKDVVEAWMKENKP